MSVRYQRSTSEARNRALCWRSLSPIRTIAGPAPLDLDVDIQPNARAPLDACGLAAITTGVRDSSLSRYCNRVATFYPSLPLSPIPVLLHGIASAPLMAWLRQEMLRFRRTIKGVVMAASSSSMRLAPKSRGRRDRPFRGGQRFSWASRLADLLSSLSIAWRRRG